MPLPSNYSTRQLHGRWITFPDGEPAAGTVTFVASVAHLVSSSEELVILTKPITGTLDENGEITVSLPSTSDPDISPTGFSYAVTETIGNRERAYSIHVPEGVETLELATVVPVAPTDGTSPYVLVADKGVPGGVATLDAGGIVPAGQLPSLVNSVNGETGTVTIDAADVGASPDTHAHDSSYASIAHNHDAAYSGIDHAHDTEYAAFGHDHDFPVDSVDGRTGMVTLDDLYASIGHNHDSDYAAAGHTHPEPDHPVDSVDGRTGVVTLDDLYADTGHSHPDPEFPVTSVNTETGDVVLSATDVGAAASGHDHDADYAAAGHGHDYPVDSVDGRTGAVTLGDLYADEAHSHPDPDFPVDSVNGEIGAVVLDAADVGAATDVHDHDTDYAASGHTHPDPDFPVDSVDGRTGDVILGDLYADSGHDHDADYAASGHDHDGSQPSFTGLTVDNNNNMSDGDPPAMEIGGGSFRQMQFDSNEIRVQEPTGEYQTLFLNPGDNGTVVIGATSPSTPRIRGIDFGAGNYAFDANGNATIPHTLGVSPTAMIVSPARRDLNCGVGAATTTDFLVRGENTGGGRPTNQNEFLRWIIIAEG